MSIPEAISKQNQQATSTVCAKQNNIAYSVGQQEDQNVFLESAGFFLEKNTITLTGKQNWKGKQNTTNLSFPRRALGSFQAKALSPFAFWRGCLPTQMPCFPEYRRKGSTPSRSKGDYRGSIEGHSRHRDLGSKNTASSHTKVFDTNTQITVFHYQKLYST